MCMRLATYTVYVLSRYVCLISWLYSIRVSIYTGVQHLYSSARSTLNNIVYISLKQVLMQKISLVLLHKEEEPNWRKNKRQGVDSAEGAHLLNSGELFVVA